MVEVDINRAFGKTIRLVRNKIYFIFSTFLEQLPLSHFALKPCPSFKPDSPKLYFVPSNVLSDFYTERIEIQLEIATWLSFSENKHISGIVQCVLTQIKQEWDKGRYRKV